MRVSPGARRRGVVGRYGDGWKVSVAAAPERGRANAALVALLAEALAVPADSLAVVAGVASRDKVVDARGLDAAEIDRRLTAAIGCRPHRQGR